MSIKESNLALATKLASSTLQSRSQCEADMEKMTELTFQFASFADLHFLTTGKTTSSSKIILFLRKNVGVTFLSTSFISSFFFLFRIMRIIHDGDHSYKKNWT